MRDSGLSQAPGFFESVAVAESSRRIDGLSPGCAINAGIGSGGGGDQRNQFARRRRMGALPRVRLTKVLAG
jgi:hypothetical protein